MPLLEGTAVLLLLGVGVSLPPCLTVVVADEDDVVFVVDDGVCVGGVSPSWVTMMTLRTAKDQCVRVDII